jgi:hypothetical protein
MADATAAGLAQASAQSAFKLFRERRFRQLARLDELSQTEEDRIFNELVIAFLMVIVLLLEAPDLRAPREFREYLKDLKDKLPAAYVKILKDLGVKKKHLREWDKLMAMRYDEYARDRHSVRSAAM